MKLELPRVSRASKCKFPVSKEQSLSVSAGDEQPFAGDERGLSTLEWILIVAAVGGLATMGIFIVRNATDASSDQVDGETDQTMVALIAEADADADRVSRKMMRGNIYNSKQRRHRCHRVETYYGDWDIVTRMDYFDAEGKWRFDENGQTRSDLKQPLQGLREKWGDLFSFGWKLDLDNDGVIDPWTREREEELVAAGEDWGNSSDLKDTNSDGLIDGASGVCGAFPLLS